MNNNANKNKRNPLPIIMGVAGLLILALFGLMLYLNLRPGNTAQEGEKAIALSIVSEKDELQQDHSFTTELETLGDLLVEEKLVEYEDSAYGRFITSAAGIQGGENNYYWMIYVNGEAAQTGMDEIMLESGASYKLSLEESSFPAAE